MLLLHAQALSMIYITKLHQIILLVVHGVKNYHGVFTHKTKHLLISPCCVWKRCFAGLMCFTILSTSFFLFKKKNLWQLQPNFPNRSIFVTLFERPLPGLWEHRLTALANCWHFTVRLVHIWICVLRKVWLPPLSAIIAQHTPACLPGANDILSSSYTLRAELLDWSSYTGTVSGLLWWTRSHHLVYHL